MRHFDPSAQGPMIAARVDANLVAVPQESTVDVAGLLLASADEDSLRWKKLLEYASRI